MKKFLAYLLIGAFCISFAGCQVEGGGTTAPTASSSAPENDGGASTRPTASTTQTTATTSTTATTATSATQGKDTEEWRTHPEDYKLVAFTFDDAPSYNAPGNNMGTRIVDLFNEYEGAATFFVNGYKIMSKDGTGEIKGVEMLEYAVNNGFELGNHTYSHLNMNQGMTKEEIKEEILGVNEILEILFKTEPKFVRPGYLAANATVKEVCAELGMHLIHEGTVSMRDSSSDAQYDANYIYNTAMTNIKDGCIVLMHDWPGKTEQALKRIIPELYEQGYRFVTLTELFEYRGIDVDSLPTDRWIYGVEDGQPRVS